MARKQDTEARKLGIVGRVLKAAAEKILAPIFRFVKKDETAGEKRAKKKAKTETPRETVEPAVRRTSNESVDAPIVPIEASERHGAARDERSFEQKRRGGPVTGEAPGKTQGPRHAGGAKKRGRDGAAEILDAMSSLAIFDYDSLSAEQIRARVSDGMKELRAEDIRQLVQYEVANKHRKSVVSFLESSLAEKKRRAA